MEILKAIPVIWWILIGLEIVSIGTTIYCGISEAKASRVDYKVKHLIRDVIIGLFGIGLVIDVVALVEFLGAVMLAVLVAICLLVIWVLRPLGPLFNKKLISNESTNTHENTKYN